ncbi:MAG: Flp pilus assembly complex ATPase component [Candidatus Nitrohelix vancouverensis]|uniref:Flp pilus assembly complex ATPase component n=1 Tax=Candidatus Nitrohelix vancouverensis TaxID=2705534 RepID=A0A7T0G308_9BACT|nr:MAG: Flp pilus assembly complex ATPase component [Candidatus Nitrohelix vancouverensis]
MALGEKLRLGDVLVKAGVITSEQLGKALAAQKQYGIPLGRVLIKSKLLTEEKLAVSLSEQLNIPFIDLQDITIEQDAVSLINENLARLHKLIPISLKGGLLKIAMVDPLNIFAIDEVTIKSGKDIDINIATETDINRAIQEEYGVAASIQAAVKSLGNLEDKKEEEKSLLGDNAVATKELEVDSPVAKLVKVILSQALDDGASDIHIEPGEDSTKIRYRIDGVLFEASSPPKTLESALISRIKVLANMDIAETRSPQDGGFGVDLGKPIELRVSTCPTVYGENMVLRILDKSNLRVDLSQSGLIGDNLTKVNDLLAKPYGVILVTGPTGSGKTTTLYGALQKLNTPEKNIKTIEDPVEYRLTGIRQTQVNPKAHITFATGLRSLMRQDPDIIMVGEIRDPETAEIAIQAALTGHLVLSTLHTNDAPGAISRLADLGAEPFLLSSSIIGVIAQRLIRTICQNCKEPRPATDEELKVLFPNGDAKPVTLMEGAGCKACKRSGYSGRLGVFEVLVVSDEIRAMILKGASPMEIRGMAKEIQNMSTLRGDGIAKVLMGLTTVKELNRVTFAD